MVSPLAPSETRLIKPANVFGSHHLLSVPLVRSERGRQEAERYPVSFSGFALGPAGTSDHQPFAVTVAMS